MMDSKMSGGLVGQRGAVDALLLAGDDGILRKLVASVRAMSASFVLRSSGSSFSNSTGPTAASERRDFQLLLLR